MSSTRTNMKLPYPKLRGNLKRIVYPAWVEIKYDGILGWCEFTRAGDNSNATVWNKSGKIYQDTDHRQAKIKECCCQLLVIGEIVKGNGKKGDLKNVKPNDSGFLPFDVLEYNWVSQREKPLIERLELLNSVVEGPTPFRVIQSESEVMEYYNKWTQKGYEGIVVKNLNERYMTGPCNWVKIKAKDQNDYFVFSIDPTLDRIEVAVPAPTGISGKYVGVKVTPAVKATLKKCDTVIIEHQGVTASGSLRHPVFIKKVEDGDGN